MQKQFKKAQDGLKPKFVVGRYIRRTVEWVMHNDPEYIIWFKNHVPKCYTPFDNSVVIQALDIIEQRKAAKLCESQSMSVLDTCEA